LFGLWSNVSGRMNTYIVSKEGRWLKAHPI